MGLVFGSILVISIVPAVGAWWARRTNSSDLLFIIYATFAVLSQILASKIAFFDLGFTTATAPAAVLVFAVTFMITDIVNEKFGRRTTQRMIALTFGSQLIMVLFLLLADALPPAPFWQNQDAWKSVLLSVPRITLASWITFLVSENLDAFLFSHIRKVTKGRHLWARSVFSSIPALTVDTVLFISLAFAGTDLPLWQLMVGQFFAKWAVGILDIPFMYLNRYILGPVASLDETSK